MGPCQGKPRICRGGSLPQSAASKKGLYTHTRLCEIHTIKLKSLFRKADSWPGSTRGSRAHGSGDMPGAPLQGGFEWLVGLKTEA